MKKFYIARGNLCRGITVHNDVERKLQIRSGVATEKQIFNCGMPRLDKYHRPDSLNTPQLHRIKASQYPFSGLPRVPHKTGDQKTIEYRYRTERTRLKMEKLLKGYCT